MAAISFPVTGPPLSSPRPADGSLPLRLEIHDLQQNHPEQWTLFILGLDAFQKQPETQDISFYGIAGIHGRPYRTWGGVKGNPAAEWEGYCTHSSILFAPWHRPYLALYEQVLYGIIQGIASRFTGQDREKYVDAAKDFRVPYWDWAVVPADGDYFPTSVGGSPTISVATPESGERQVQIANPLYSYHFNPLNPLKGDFPPDIHSKWTHTLRYPTSTGSAGAESQDDMVLQALESQFEGIQSNVNILMNDPNYQGFAAFSNHQWAPDAPGAYGSLENVHDSIHGEVGGNGGHMSDLDYAAFDPVFWLHHANVDRLFAIWQGLNPKSYTINEVDPRGTFTIEAGTREIATTALEPFKDTSGTKTWNSLSVRGTETFGYAYPETQKWKFTSDAQYKTSIQIVVQQLYGGPSNEFLGQDALNFMATGVNEGSTNGNGAQERLSVKNGASNGSVNSAEAVISRGDGDFEAEIAENGAHPTKTTQSPGSFTNFIVNIRASKHVLNQTYRVHIFLGPFDGRTGTWHTQSALIGTFVVLGRAVDTGCGKCKKDRADDITITGTVPLTSALLKEVKNGNLGSMEKENVVSYLKDNLHWRVTLADGTDKPREEVPGLTVSVVSTEVSLPEGGLPVYSGVYEVHPQCTEGRPAGHNSGDRC